METFHQCTDRNGSQKRKWRTCTGYGRGLIIEDLDYRYLDAVTDGKDVSNNSSSYAMVSYFGKVNYAYDEKYLVSGTLRRDASSRFGNGNNSAIFPSVSAGWRISREISWKLLPIGLAT